ncbi:TetR-like C-terminal domain-containing protein [Asanoa siamensis]|uniref:Tetracyclin repressor-like C-terminal domain-containing protein n=1 Tax=Asanoa siamensis TaxID=926357 RepID=A0ABQ4CY80_9ACTN|nr:hypothetical protein Asi02nite_57480 [Asanoa siamensis]
MKPRAGVARDRLERGRSQGQLRADANLDDVVEILYGPICYRAQLHKGPPGRTGGPNPPPGLRGPEP